MPIAGAEAMSAIPRSHPLVDDHHMSLRLANFPLPEQHLIPIGLATLLHWLRPQRLPLPGLVRHAAGWPLVAAGWAIALWATRAADEVPLSSPNELVRTGPYAISRNPMYLGWTLAHLGAAVLTGSAWIVGSLPVALVLNHWQILSEERRLSETFGAEFAEYFKAVPRYLILHSAGD